MYVCRCSTFMARASRNKIKPNVSKLLICLTSNSIITSLAGNLQNPIRNIAQLLNVERSSFSLSNCSFPSMFSIGSFICLEPE